MKIFLAQHYGLCFGVRDALAEAARLAETVPLTMLGELVHNPVVVSQLEAQGVKRGELRSIQAETQHVMITAHGASNERRMAWNSAGFSVADATCPLVHRAHDTLAGLVAAGCFPVVIGKRGHVEVLGLTGDFPNALVVESETDLRDLPESPHYGVIAQTTQPMERVERLVSLLRASRPESVVTFRDTVCQPTKNRQNALRQLLETCDTMVVVGGRNSNNTLQLVAAASVAGLDVHHVERPNELQLDWFFASRNVGLTAGTSTLKETVAAVHARLQEIAVELA